MYIETLTRNHFCRGRAVSVRYSEGAPIPVAARSNPWIRSRCLLGIRVRIPPGAQVPVSCDCCVCCHVEVFATDWSLVQRSPTECGVFEFEREAR
jgi:hypothetical protein